MRDVDALLFDESTADEETYHLRRVKRLLDSIISELASSHRVLASARKLIMVALGQIAPFSEAEQTYSAHSTCLEK